MKRALAMLLTVAMLGSLMFMGFAGTAAAHNYDDDGQSNDAKIVQDQVTVQDATASSDGSVALAFGDDATANTGNSVEQTSDNEQNASITQTNENIQDSLFLDL